MKEGEKMDVGGMKETERGCNRRMRFGLKPVREDGERGQREERQPLRGRLVSTEPNHNLKNHPTNFSTSTPTTLTKTQSFFSNPY